MDAWVLLLAIKRDAAMRCSRILLSWSVVRKCLLTGQPQKSSTAIASRPCPSSPRRDFSTANKA